MLDTPPKRLRPSCGAVLVVLLLSGSARADSWPVQRGPSHEPAPYRYDAKVWSHVPREFLDNYSACILYYGTTHLIDADGTVETITHEITRLGGRKGIDSLGEYRSISYDPTYQTLALNAARVLKPDGRVVEIEPRHMQVRDVSTDFQTYDRDKQVVISFPNLEVGDCYEVKWTTRGKNPEFAGKFFSRVTFGDDQYPIVRDELRLRLPRAMPLHHATVNGTLAHMRNGGVDHCLYHWWSTNRKPLPQDADRPSKETQRLQLIVSTFASWAEVGRWKEALRAQCWSCTPEIRQQVEKVTSGLKTPEEKARALTYWVRRAIRYISISSTGKGYTPRTPAAVFASRFGDCKDQGQLLAVMLKEAGLDVSLVTLGILDDGQVLSEVPSPWGTHGILLVKIDGKEHWIDTTTSLAGWDLLPRADRDRVAYVTQGSDLKLLRTPLLTYEDNRIVQLTHLTVQPDGSTVGRRAAQYFGLAALSRRDVWMEVPPGQRRRLVTAELQDAHSRSRLVNFLIDDRALADLDQPVTASVEFQIAGHFSGDAGSREGSLTDSNVWNRLLAYNLDPERTSPLHLWAPFDSVHRYIVHLPLAYRFESMPADRIVKSKWGVFELRVKAEPNEPRRLEITFHTRLDNVQVDPTDFAAFQRFHDEVSRHWRLWLTLKPTQDVADAPVLDLYHTLTRGVDRHSAAVLARLYLQHGKHEDARRVVRQARAFHATDTALCELIVQCARGLAEEEQAYAEMTRLFPNEPKYALALGATRIKRGNHVAARVLLVPLITDAPDDIRAQAHVQLARSSLARKHPETALQHLEAARQAHAETAASGAVLRLKAEAQTALGRAKEAIATYREALRFESEVDEVLPPLIELELAAGQKREALESLRRLATRAGNDRQALVRAGEVYLRAGRIDDALELAGRARDLGFSSRGQRLLGLIQLRKGDFEKAVMHLERAELDAEVVEGLIRGHIALGKLYEARRHAEAAAKLGETSSSLREAEALLSNLEKRRDELVSQVPESGAHAMRVGGAAAAVACAEYLRQLGRPVAEIERLVSAAINADVPLGSAYALRGLLLLERGRLRQALADAERATALSPRCAQAFCLRGRVRLERGDYGALGDLLRAADLSQQRDAGILHWLAAAQFAIGHRTQALEIQGRAARLRPDDPEIDAQLRDFEQQVNGRSAASKK